MPQFDQVLIRHGQSASGIVAAGETVRAVSPPGSVPYVEWSVPRLEALHELAFLRVFAAWESCLEEIFFRTLCGYASAAAGQETIAHATYFRSIVDAQRHVMGAGTFLLWHNPTKVMNRCHGYIRNGTQEAVIASNLGRLGDLAAIRHRIAHDQADAKRQFDIASGNFSGNVYRGSRPGRFLRDWEPALYPRRRWLEVLTGELCSLLHQMV